MRKASQFLVGTHDFTAFAVSHRKEEKEDFYKQQEIAYGDAATEALIGAKGFKTYMDFVTTFPTAADWKLEFKKAFGLTPDEFYLKLAPYLRSRLAG